MSATVVLRDSSIQGAECKQFFTHGTSPAVDTLAIIRNPADRGNCSHETFQFSSSILTAFRMHPSGAQGWLGIVPDLAVLGKALGAEMPISAIVGQRAVRPEGNSELSGTYLGLARSALLVYPVETNTHGQCPRC
jgi:hypothetical protein